MTSRALSIRFAVLGAPLLMAVLYPMQIRIDEQTGGVRQEKEALLLRSGRMLKKLSLGYESLLANLYWTRAVQYYGGAQLRNDPDLELLAPLLDLTTTLDPQLLVAYKFGAIFLAEPRPKGAGRPDLAVNLMRKGIAANPDQWRLWGDLGFIYYQDLKDYEKAAAAYREGSKNPRARDWMRVMAAKIAQEGGSREVSRLLWTEIHESTRDPNIRKNAIEHLRGLKAEEDLEGIERISAEFERRFKRRPTSIGEMVGAGLLPGVPVDPSGLPYVLGRDGRVSLHPRSKIVLEVPRPAPPA